MGNWHILFLINVPIAIVLFILAFMKLKESADPSPGRLDLIGTIILSFAILSIMYGLTNIDINFWASFKQPRFLMVLLIGALSGGILAGMIFIPAFTENVLGITAEKSGYWMTPLALAAGVGIGVILGAPLNILATEGLKSDKGSALASLSLLRQIGMTIAPTIYAGFIARGYNNMGNLFKNDFQDVLQANVAQADLSKDALGELAQIGQQLY